MNKLINWRIFFLLLTASMLSIVAILPYAFSLQWDIIRQIPLPLPLIIGVTLLQNGIIFAILIFLGLFVSQKIWLWLRYIEAYWENKKITPEMKNVFKKSLLLGAGIGFVIIITDIVFKKIWVVVWGDLSIPIWQWFLASFYGWIAEEILLRLFLMSLLIWILHTIFKSHSQWKVRNAIIWASILITAIIFWVWHLPAVAQITELTDGVIVRTIVLNALWGVVFWYLYWKNGLESAMIAHFSADIVLHVVLPMSIAIYAL